MLSTPRKNDSGTYYHADAQFFIEQVDCELKRRHNEFTNDGMKGLTSEDSTNKLMLLHSNATITWQAVISASQKKVKARKTKTHKGRRCRP